MRSAFPQAAVDCKSVLSDLSPGQLLHLCLNRPSEEAWMEFTRRCHPVIAGNAARIAAQYGCNTSTVVEDIVQDVYVKLCDENCRILRGFRDLREDGLYAYLKVVSANVARDRCQSMTAVKRGSGKVVSLSTENESVPINDAFASRLEHNSLLQRVEAALAHCAAKETATRDQSIFWLFYRQEFTAREIAAIPAFALTAKGVESLLRRLVHCVRSEMARTAGVTVAGG
jgi:DNA-directed RNA polymerase specialized sigma24 family protein